MLEENTDLLTLCVLTRPHTIASTKGTHKSSQDVFSTEDQKVEASDQDAKNTKWSL